MSLNMRGMAVLPRPAQQCWLLLPSQPCPPLPHCVELTLQRDSEGAVRMQQLSVLPLRVSQLDCRYQKHWADGL